MIVRAQEHYFDNIITAAIITGSTAGALNFDNGARSSILTSNIHGTMLQRIPAFASVYSRDFECFKDCTTAATSVSVGKQLLL